MLYNAKEQKLNLHNTQVDYITFGKGSRPLVMIQGLNTRGIKGAALSLAFMYRIFATDYKVYLFERPGDIKDGITARELASWLAGAMDALGIINADILGVSQGGMIAQYLAIDRPDLVRKMVLAVTLSRNNDTVIPVIEKWIGLAEQGKMKELVADMALKMYSELYRKRYQLFMPLLTILQKPKDVPRFVALAKSCLTCNAYEELMRIKCPVLVIGASRDEIVGGMASEEIAEKLDCQLYMYETLGHAAYEEAQDFNERVYNFFRE